MNFLLTSLGFLAVATGLPFPQEFLSAPSPPPIYQQNIPSENYRGFRVQQTLPEGNTVSKVVIQVPTDSLQRTHDGFQRNPIVQHYYPDNGQHQQATQIQYQEVPQRIQYVPQGVPETMPHLFLPAQSVAQAVEQVPQGIHYSVQRSEQVPRRSQQPIDVPVQQFNAQSISQNNFVQKVVQAVPDVQQPGIPEGVQNIQQISPEGQQVLNVQQQGSVLSTVPYVDVNQIHKEPGVSSDKNVQSHRQSTQSEAQPVNIIPPEQSPPQGNDVTVQQPEDSRRPQNEQEGNYVAVQQPQDSRRPQNEQPVQEAPKDTYNLQRTPEVQQGVDQQHQDRPEQTVVTVQHGPNGVQIIRQGEPNSGQQPMHQNLVQGVNEQFQNIHRTENTSAQQLIQHQITDVQREQVVHPLVQVIQHGAQGVQKIREGEHNKKYAEPQRPSESYFLAGQKVDNAIAGQHVSHIPNNQIDQREPSGIQQPVVIVQHGPSGVHIIRQEEAQKSQQHRQQQQDLQQNIQSTKPSQNEVNAAPLTQHTSQEVHPTFNDPTSTALGVTQAVLYGDTQKPRPDAQAQGQASYETGNANALPQNQAQSHQSVPAQAKPAVANPSHQTNQVSHFSFGFQDHSSVVKHENQNKEAAPVSHFSFGTQAVANLDAQKTEAAPQTQQIQTKPQHPEPGSSSVQHLPPSLHQVDQNVVEVPQVSQTIKETTTHGVQAIPAAVEQGVQQLTQGVQQTNPVTESVRNVYQGIRNTVHPAILSSAEAFVNSIQRDKEPIHSQQLQKVLDQIQLVRQEVRQKQDTQRPSSQEGALDQENRQIPLQEEELSQQNQKPFQSGFHPFQNQGQRGQPARPPYGNRKPVQSAPVNQIYDNTPHRVESPAEDDVEPTPIPIIRYENSVGPDGTYQWSYEAGNGIKAQESGLLRNRGDPDTESIAVQGGYSYTGPDGILYSVEYIADENGFQPLGRHLPTQPPIPEALQKAIDEHMAILATAQPDTDEPTQTDNNLSSSLNKYNYSQRVS